VKIALFSRTIRKIGCSVAEISSDYISGASQASENIFLLVFACLVSIEGLNLLFRTIDPKLTTLSLRLVPWRMHPLLRVEVPPTGVTLDKFAVLADLSLLPVVLRADESRLWLA
jgi:hypothetical protein